MTTASPSLDGLRANPCWAKLSSLNRKDWKRVRFGDVVENLNETERNPVEAGVERFIGLGHLGSGSSGTSRSDSHDAFCGRYEGEYENSH